jgi:hypothetical protein
VTDLDQRYGRTAGATRRTRWIAIGAAAAFALAFGAWLWWGGLLEPPAQFEARNIGHEVLSPAEIAVTWQFTAEPGTSAKCAVQALNEAFGIVGWRIVDVPASDERTRRITEVLRTAEPAASGLIYRCWLT